MSRYQVSHSELATVGHQFTADAYCSVIVGWMSAIAPVRARWMEPQFVRFRSDERSKRRFRSKSMPAGGL